MSNTLSIGHTGEAAAATREGVPAADRRRGEQRRFRVRRRHKRLLSERPVQCRAGEVELTGVTRDIGAGGVFLRAERVPGIGEEVELSIDAGGSLVRVRGRVVRAEPAPGAAAAAAERGVAVTFADDSAARAALACFVLGSLEADARGRLQRNSSDAQALRDLADVYRERGMTDQAIAHYRRVIELLPGDQEAHGNLAELLAEYGAETGEERYYREALQLFDVAISGGHYPYFKDSERACRVALDSLRRNAPPASLDHGAQAQRLEMQRLHLRVEREELGRERRALEDERRQLADLRAQVLDDVQRHNDAVHNAVQERLAALQSQAQGQTQEQRRQRDEIERQVGLLNQQREALIRLQEELKARAAQLIAQREALDAEREALEAAAAELEAGQAALRADLDVLERERETLAELKLRLQEGTRRLAGRRAELDEREEAVLKREQDLQRKADVMQSIEWHQRQRAEEQHAAVTERQRLMAEMEELRGERDAARADARHLVAAEEQLRSELETLRRERQASPPQLADRRRAKETGVQDGEATTAMRVNHLRYLELGRKRLDTYRQRVLDRLGTLDAKRPMESFVWSFLWVIGLVICLVLVHYVTTPG